MWRREGEFLGRTLTLVYVVMQNKAIGSSELQKQKQELELSPDLALPLRQQMENQAFSYLTSM